MNRVLFCISLFFSLFWANAQNNEVWYEENHYMIRGIQEAKDHGIWIYYLNGAFGLNGSVLKKMSINGEILLTIEFTNYLALEDLYEYGNGNIFFSLSINDPNIKSPQGAGVFMIYDEYGNKLKEHVFLPHPDSLELYSKLTYGNVLDIIPVNEYELETDIILLGYNSIGWDDPENPGDEFFLGTMVGLERVDCQGNRIWTKRLTQFYNWGLPNLIKLQDGNMIVTTNAVIFPNAPDSTNYSRDGAVLLKMDMEGNVIWQNNTLVDFNGEFQTTKPKKTVEIRNGNLIVPAAITHSLGSSVWYSGVLTLNANGETLGYSFVGDTSQQVGMVQLEYLDSNTLIYACKYNTAGQGPSLPSQNSNYNVYTIDTLGNTINEWHSIEKIWSTSALMVPEDTSCIYASPTNWYSGDRSRILKFNTDLTPYIPGVDTFSYNVTQNQNLDGLFVDLDYYAYLDSVRSISLNEYSNLPLVISPNPGQTESHILAPDHFLGGEVYLYTIEGRLLYSASWHSDLPEFTLPINQLENGIYEVVVRSGNRFKWTGKLEVVK